MSGGGPPRITSAGNLQARNPANALLTSPPSLAIARGDPKRPAAVRYR